jgi:Transposase, Mutator family
VRHSNFIERTFGETRRRVKVIGRLPGEHSCLKLVWAVLDRANAGWRGFTMTPAGLRLLANLRRTLHDPPPELPHRDPETNTATSLAPTDSVTAIAWNHEHKRAEPRQVALHRSWDATINTVSLTFQVSWRHGWRTAQHRIAISDMNSPTTKSDTDGDRRRTTGANSQLGRTTCSNRH